MRLNCNCGVILDVAITEGSFPGAKEREEITCVSCGTVLHSQVYNHAMINIKVIANPHKKDDNSKD